MQIEFDPVKSAKNERGLSFGVTVLMFDSMRLEWEDRRKGYGETRINTLGQIEGRVFFTCFTQRKEAIRIISFRKANNREVGRYRRHIHEQSPSDKGRLGDD